MPFDLLPRVSGVPVRHWTAHPLAGVTVLQIVPGLDADGLGCPAIDIAAALDRVGATALVASRGGTLVSELQVRGGTFIPYPVGARNPLSMASSMRRLARLIEQESVDIVHVGSRLAAWVAYGATRMTRTPLVTDYHASYARGGPLALRYNSVMARGDMVLAESDPIAQALALQRPTAPDSIRVVGPGVDTRKFAAESVVPARIEALRRAWAIAADEPIVLFVGRLRLPHEPRILFQTAQHLQSEQRTRFVAMTSGRDASTYIVDTGSAGRSTRLEGILRRAARCADRPAALLAASVVVVLAGDDPSLSRIAHEAQAMGTPVIVESQGALSETVVGTDRGSDGRPTGWHANPGDATALASRISAALGLGATAKGAMAARARARVEARFSIDHRCRETLAAYADLRSGK